MPVTSRPDPRPAEPFVEPALQQHYNSAFKIALLDQWVVILTGKQLVEDLRKRPDSELSFLESVEDVRQAHPLALPALRGDGRSHKPM